MIKRFFSLYHYLWALTGALFYRFPSRKLIVIGVTGTTGKSSTVEMIGAILGKAGYKTALSSSIRFEIAGISEDNLMKQTMPGRAYLQSFLRQAVNYGCRYAVIEVSSEGIRQHRHRFINFDVAVLTNLAPEHVEAHGSFENYKNEKLKLFRQLASSAVKSVGGKPVSKFIIVNQEVPQAAEFTVGETEVIKFDSRKDDALHLKLVGDFWYLNANAALAVASSQKINKSVALEALNNISGIPGRMEEIKEGQDFRVFVDYAHTPVGLEAVYKTLRETCDMSHETCRLICVLGAAGGGRDKWKRPEFGKIAWQYCDEIILTDEDPYDENPDKILDQIASGIPSSKPNRRILDRAEAIRRAIDLAESGDIVVITGKGCEPWMLFGRGEKIPWDDRKIVRDYLKEKRSA